MCRQDPTVFPRCFLSHESDYNKEHDECPVVRIKRKTGLMVPVKESIRCYPHPSNSTKAAFQWTLDTIICNSTSDYIILFLHVQEPDEDGFDDIDSVYASPDDFKKMKRQDKKTGHHLLEYFVNQCHKLGIECEAWIKSGDAKKVIVHEAKRVRPDLLVVGRSRYLAPLQRVFASHVSDYCTKHAECPVVSIKRKKTRLMVPVKVSNIKGYPHPSRSSYEAFQWALNNFICNRNSAYKILFLHVQVPDKDGFDDIDSVYASPDDFKKMKEQDKKKGHHLLEYFVNQCHELGIECEAWIKRGDAKKVIVHEANRVTPDLLVVGRSRDLGPLQRLFRSTINEYCHKHARCPYVVFKPRAETTVS